MNLRREGTLYPEEFWMPNGSGELEFPLADSYLLASKLPGRQIREHENINNQWEIRPGPIEVEERPTTCRIRSACLQPFEGPHREKYRRVSARVANLDFQRQCAPMHSCDSALRCTRVGMLRVSTAMR